MAIGLKTYEEFSVKKDSSDYLVTKKDGSPELGERIKEVRLDEQTVTLLNTNWKNFLKYYVLKDDNAMKEIKLIEVTKLDVPDAPPPVLFKLGAEKDLADLKLFLDSEEEFKYKVDTMTKKNFTDVMDVLGIAHDPKNFGKTSKDTFADSVRTFLKEQKIQNA